MSKFKAALPLLVGLFGLVAYGFTFVVYQWEMALKLQVGKIVEDNYRPGLHFRVPFWNSIVKFDRRIQTLDSRPQRFLTLEKKDVIVDSYVKFRIRDGAKYYRSTGGDLFVTSTLLSDRINTSLRDEFGKRSVQEVIAGDRVQIMELLRKDANEKASEIGVEVVDVRVKKIDLPPEVSESVYNRMRAERERVARNLRAQGAEAAEKIRADADRQEVVIKAEAYRDGERLRGEGDSKAAEIYAKAFSKDPDFYAFSRSLEAYQKSFSGGGNLMVLDPNSDFFRYLKDKQGR